MGFFFRKEDKFHFFIRNLVGYNPRDFSIFRQAFVHKSSDGAEHGANNERLEYLGDSILGAIVSADLYQKYPSADEGRLSRVRANLVCRQRLNQIATDLGMCEYISFHTPQTLNQTHIPGDVVEALVAAIYLDGGMRRAEKFIRERIASAEQIKEMADSSNDKNFKSELLEWGQKMKQTVVFATESDKNNIGFRSTVRVSGEILGEGTGRTKKQAEQKAAEVAFGRL